MRTLGDFALVGGARGGIVLAAGVSERMIEFLEKDETMEQYFNHGVCSNYIHNIPIKLLKNPIAPLICRFH